MEQLLISVQPVSSWSFKVEYWSWLSISVLNTFLVSYWLMSGLKKIPLSSPIGRVYMTLSIIAAAVYSYAFFIFLALRRFGVFTLAQAKESCNMWLLLQLPWAINRAFLYLYFLWRIHLVFGKTRYKIKKSKIIALSVSVCVMFILCWICSYVFGERVGCQASHHGFFLMLPFVFTDCVFSGLTLFLFISRLKISNKLKDKDLQYLTSKFTILQSVTVICTVATNSIFLALPILAFVGVDASLNCICLMLSLKGHDAYYKRLCILCRCCCERISEEEANIDVELEIQEGTSNSTNGSSV